MMSNERDILKVENENKLKLGGQSCSKIHNRVGQKLTPEKSENRVYRLKEIIQENLIGCDLTICIFKAAVRSYRVESCLRPFPPCFTTGENEKDFKKLRIACNKIPPLQDFLKQPPNQCPDDVSNILTWLFTDSGLPVLKLCKIEDTPLMNEKHLYKAPPKYVFEVNFTPKVNQTWENRIKQREVFYAFHGSSTDNFYSILKFGLQQHFSTGKEVLFGNGIYLSTELSVCTNYAPFCSTWSKSILGNRHSIIAQCEIINDENEVKCKDEKNKKRAVNTNSLGEIPEKYYVVTNSELVKVKYLLVYTYKSTPFMKPFIKKNFFWIALIFYCIMLGLVGFFNSPYWRKFVRSIGF
ncbi:protein mono-ADP-ribosyltransferase PARP16-like [Cylas formicarius]|uniref:protein mono-ADP-ribosyltransferase PARP16-like n=1 Tax=Cylas formicarius TaxID=197179 RepID=UPI002958C785|nr:protein mono-ADP-ribosyltransferase PARP16-like [Cylas formicarius]